MHLCADDWSTNAETPAEIYHVLCKYLLTNILLLCFIEPAQCLVKSVFNMNYTTYKLMILCRYSGRHIYIFSCFDTHWLYIHCVCLTAH